MVFLVIVLVVVHSVDNVQDGIFLLLDWSGHEHLLDPFGEVDVECVPGQELAAALQHELDAVLVPRHVPGGGVRGVGDGLAVDDDVPVDEGAIFGPLSVDRVVLGEVRGGFARAGELVDVDKLELRVVVREVEREASDATETWEVDGEVETEAIDRQSWAPRSLFTDDRGGGAGFAGGDGRLASMRGARRVDGYAPLMPTLTMISERGYTRCGK